MNLQIQCPKCSKRFTIHEDLSGKTVECGSCDHRFPVKPESIIVEKAKIYPGEHKGDDFLNRLGRQPGQKRSKASISSAAPVPQVDAIMPASPARNIAVAVGMGVMILYGVLFLAGTTKGGFFEDMEMAGRVVLTSFVSVVGFAMVVYGAKTWRFLATTLALVVVASLAAMTLLRPVRVTPEVSDVLVVPKEPTAEPVDEESDESSIRRKVGYPAVERKIRELGERFGPAAREHLVAIFIEDLKPGQFFYLETYFKRAFGIPLEEAVNRYKRNGEQDSLIVISGFPIDFDEAVRLCDPRLGRATTYPQLRLITLKLSAIHSSRVSDDMMKILSDPGSRAFFSLNLRELGALDPERAKNAVRNLSTVPDEIALKYQDEIVTEFMQLLGAENDEVLLSDLARAFRRWGRENQAALVVVAQKVGNWLEAGTKVQPGFLEYLIENKEPKALVYVDELWSKEPELWSGQYKMMGAVAEPRLIEHLEGSSLRRRQAAASILGAIGTELSLPILKKYKDVSDEELKINVEKAIKDIESR